MRNLFLALLLLVGFNTVNAQQLKSPYFTFSPTLTPDGETIVFSYEGDLWKVSINGGQAYRMTAMEGEETRPAVSPDGKWLAFSAEQFGNADVFIMPIEGGEIQQLTYHEATDEVESWSWDSQTIYFTSNRYNRYTAFEINIAGSTPKRLFPNYFNTVHNTVVSPVNGEIFFNESWESKNFAHRKRYKGEYNPDIKSYNPKTKVYQQYTDYEGKDFGASIDQNGNLYFMSDEANGEYNLYTLKSPKKLN
ncbi:hypothetical protein [Algoriphagus lutimaris]|uniref:hypothetical protein n=1 Tax=Algoriphagus lutimaris TaxID=613197 RepID=UPI001FAF6310|nr:hypothetical protein [Algoriphagus lutimaris]